MTLLQTPSQAPVGLLLREWRQRRHLSQMDLALDAGISTRHLSCVETGRAQPSREMVLRLARELQVPLREQNVLLTAAGYAPVYPERPLDDPALQQVHRTLLQVLQAHEPHPALLVDRHWTLQAMNRAVSPLFQDLPEMWQQGPINVLRLSLHPQGLAGQILNFMEWREHLLDRLKRQVQLSGDPVLAELLQELESYPVPDAPQNPAGADHLVVPLRLQTRFGVLSLLSTTTVFGTPVEVTLSELALETFFPVNRETADILRSLVQPVSQNGASSQGL